MGAFKGARIYDGQITSETLYPLRHTATHLNTRHRTYVDCNLWIVFAFTPDYEMYTYVLVLNVSIRGEYSCSISRKNNALKPSISLSLSSVLYVCQIGFLTNASQKIRYIQPDELLNVHTSNIPITNYTRIHRQDECSYAIIMLFKAQTIQRGKVKFVNVVQ